MEYDNSVGSTVPYRVGLLKSKSAFVEGMVLSPCYPNKLFKPCWPTYIPGLVKQDLLRVLRDPNDLSIKDLQSDGEFYTFTYPPSTSINREVNTLQMGTSAEQLSYQLLNYYRGQPRIIKPIGGIDADQSIYKNYDVIGRATGIFQFDNATGAQLANTSIVYYNLSNKPISIVSSPGYRQTYKYGNRYTVYYPAESNTGFEDSLVTEYDGIGRPIEVYEKTQSITDKTQSNIQTAEIDMSTYVRKSSTRYDAFNNVIYRGYTRSQSEANVEGVGIYYTYDAYGRISTSRKYNPNTTVGTPLKQYSYSGSKLEITDENGHVTTLFYKSYGDPAKKVITSYTLPPDDNGAVAIYDIESDDLGRIKSVTEANTGASTFYEYTDGDRKVKKERHSDMSYYKTFDYDYSGRLKYLNIVDNSSTQNGTGVETKTYNYDSMNRLKQVDFQDGRSKVYHYDELGRLKTIDGSGMIATTTFDYNPQRGYQEYETLQSSYGTFRFRTSHDSYTSALTSVVYPSGQSIDYLPTYDGLATAANPFVNSISRSGNKKIELLQMANGTSWGEGFNILTGLPETVSIDLPYESIGENLQHDDVGNLTNHTTVDGNTYVNSYDALNRIMSTNSGNGISQNYDYDTVNNITNIDTSIANINKSVTQILSGRALNGLLRNGVTFSVKTDKGRLLSPISPKSGSGMVARYTGELLTSLDYNRPAAIGAYRNDYEYDVNDLLHSTKTYAPNGTLEKTIITIYTSDGKKMAEYSPDSDGFSYKEFYYLEGRLIGSREFTNMSTTDSDGDGIMDSAELIAGTFNVPPYVAP